MDKQPRLRFGMKTNRDRTLTGTDLPFYSDTSPPTAPPYHNICAWRASNVEGFFHLGMRWGGINYNSSSSMRKHQLLFIFKEAKIIFISFLKCLKVSFCPSHTRLSGCSSDGGNGVLASVGIERHLSSVFPSLVFPVRAAALITKRISSTTRYWSM